MIVPAAGRGSRLRAPVPKFLVPVNGRSMLAHVLSLYREHVDRFIVVVSPGAQHLARQVLREASVPGNTAHQDRPTGMLDAILAAREEVEALGPDEVWVTWCDQIMIRTATVESLSAAMRGRPVPELMLPTVKLPDPYIHLERDAGGRFVGLRQRREGDPMPAVGESDVGLFAMSGPAYTRDLATYAATQAAVGSATGERNFLPFIPWLAARATVTAVAASDPVEAVGVNSPADLQLVAGRMEREEASCPRPCRS